VAARGWASLAGARQRGASPEEASRRASQEESSQEGTGLEEPSLDGSVPLTPDHRFPACWVTNLITATAVLRLVGDGRIGLDDPARAHLHTIRLADETVTVRDLLTHTAGVPNLGEMFADTCPTWSPWSAR
jgi:hypothetical protein